MTKITETRILLILLFALIGLFGCKKEETDTLTVSPENIVIAPEGGFTGISINTNAGSWSIDNPADWITLSYTSGTVQTAMVTLSVSSLTPINREATLTFTAGNAKPVKVVVSQEGSEFIYSLSSNITELNYKRSGNMLSLKVTTNAPGWSVSDNVDWLEYSPETGATGITSVNITAAANPGAAPRTATITIHADYAPDVVINVNQSGELYPGYNTNPLPPDQTGMASTAMQIANQITIGWNIGNTMEATGGETAWGNPLITPALIQLVKANGFNAVRIPCSFNQYMENSATAKIDQVWLNRVKTVVQYCMDEDMYAILNIHWDGGWLENNVTVAAEEANNAKQKAFWEQIATHLRDFDERLLFAGTNEPNVTTAEQMAVLNSYHQTFIDAVRSTGGKNAYRTLVIQGPSTDIEKTHSLMNVLPTDNAPNRMMLEIHYYTPWNFCGLTQNENWGHMFYYWGQGYHSLTDPDYNATWGEEPTVDYNFLLMRNQFVQQGIPVILGEYSVTRRSALTGEQLDLHLASRAYYFYYVTKMARANGIIPFYWDNGFIGNNGCALFNRQNNTVFDQQALDRLIEGATGGKKNLILKK